MLELILTIMSLTIGISAANIANAIRQQTAVIERNFGRVPDEENLP